jgi:hypothetical protein
MPPTRPGDKKPTSFTIRELQGLFDTVTDSQCIDGQYSDVIKGDFAPIMSMSMLISGVGHRRGAIDRGEKVLGILRESYAQMNQRRVEAQPQS